MRVDADDFARPCSCGREHQIAVKEILIEAGAVEKLEEEMSEGMLREYISPLVICDTNTYAATEELMEDIYDRCQVLVLDAEGLQADRHAIKIVENTSSGITMWSSRLTSRRCFLLRRRTPCRGFRDRYWIVWSSLR